MATIYTDYTAEDIANLPDMDSVALTGIFTLGGAAIGAIGTQVSGIVTATSKSRARKVKAADAEAAARGAAAASLHELH